MAANDLSAVLTIGVAQYEPSEYWNNARRRELVSFHSLVCKLASTT